MTNPNEPSNQQRQTTPNGPNRPTAPGPARPNEYGRRAQTYWATWLPSRYAQIPDPNSYFSTLGNQMAAQVETLIPQLAGEDPPGETYLQKVGRLNMAKLRAEEIVLNQWVWLTPEPGADPEEDDENSDAAATSTSGDEWIPIHADPQHPFWTAQREWQQEDPAG